jgi:alpha-amylase
MLDALDWQTRALDAQGYRIDDTKGLAVVFVSKLLNSKSMQVCRGRVFRCNPDTLNWWVWNSGMNGPCATFDFGIRFAVTAMCNNGSRWDMSQLHHSNYVKRDPAHAVTFIENHDTDLHFPAIWNKILRYAYLLTSESYPSSIARTMRRTTAVTDSSC